MFGYFTSGVSRTTQNPHEELVGKILGQYQNNTKYSTDPMYMLVMLGNLRNLHLSYTKQDAQGQKHTARYFKIDFQKDRGKIVIYDSSQSLARYWNGASRNKLKLIESQLVQFLCWFPFEKTSYQFILKMSRVGLNLLLSSYQNQDSFTTKIFQNIRVELPLKAKQENQRQGEREVNSDAETSSLCSSSTSSSSTSQTSSVADTALSSYFTSSPVEEPDQLVKCISYSSPPENAFDTIRILTDNIALIDKMLSVKESDILKLKEEYSKKNKEYFPLHQIQIIGERVSEKEKNELSSEQTCVGSTVDKYLQIEVTSMWKDDVVKTISTLFKESNDRHFVRYQAIEVLLKHYPEAYMTLKNRVFKLMNTALSSSRIEFDYGGREKDKKEKS